VGTMSEWIRILELCAVYSGLAFSWEAIKTRSATEFLEALPGWLLTGLLWAMMLVFEWRVLHGRLAIVFAILVFALFALGLAQRRRVPIAVEKS
jgi:hypothetical protein